MSFEFFFTKEGVPLLLCYARLSSYTYIYYLKMLLLHRHTNTTCNGSSPSSLLCPQSYPHDNTAPPPFSVAFTPKASPPPWLALVVEVVDRSFLLLLLLLLLLPLPFSNTSVTSSCRISASQSSNVPTLGTVLCMYIYECEHT